MVSTEAQLLEGIREYAARFMGDAHFSLQESSSNPGAFVVLDVPGDRGIVIGPYTLPKSGRSADFGSVLREEVLKREQGYTTRGLVRDNCSGIEMFAFMRPRSALGRAA